ncbi:MAG: hypothetical protein HYW65_01130 [Candidatus Liptonbacteria bacterium]|nr:hypothetical protein [Candidatus Liptonbacteria bacterium]
MKKIAKHGWLIGGIIVVLALFWWGASQPEVAEAEVVSRSGLHWHPELMIYIKGVKQDIPANIGIGIVHSPIHTHDGTGTLHLEMTGLVRKEDIRLGHFFSVWGKAFTREEIMGYRNGPEGTVKFLVSGAPNEEFENYMMRDKDKIEIRYE